MCISDLGVRLLKSLLAMLRERKKPAFDGTCSILLIGLHYALCENMCFSFSFKNGLTKKGLKQRTKQARQRGIPFYCFSCS